MLSIPFLSFQHLERRPKDPLCYVRAQIGACFINIRTQAVDTLAVDQDAGAQPGWHPGCQALGTGLWGLDGFFLFFFFLTPQKELERVLVHVPVTGFLRAVGPVARRPHRVSPDALCLTWVL